MSEFVAIAELPRFVQVRAHDKGLDKLTIEWVEGHPEGPWYWSRWLIKGTRLQPSDVAGLIDAGETRERTAHDFDITVEQVDQVLEWVRTTPRRVQKHGPKR